MKKNELEFTDNLPEEDVLQNAQDALGKVRNAFNLRNPHREISKEVLFFTHTDLYKLLFPFSWIGKRLRQLFSPDRSLRRAGFIGFMESSVFEILMMLVLGLLIGGAVLLWQSLQA